MWSDMQQGLSKVSNRTRSGGWVKLWNKWHCIGKCSKYINTLFYNIYLCTFAALVQGLVHICYIGSRSLDHRGYREGCFYIYQNKTKQPQKTTSKPPSSFPTIPNFDILTQSTKYSSWDWWHLKYKKLYHKVSLALTKLTWIQKLISQDARP